jgi:alanyl aminopeptidase
MKHRWLSVIVLIGFVGISAGVYAEPPFRLPSSVVPEAYRLELVVDPDQEVFSGHAEIDVAVVEAVEEIWLHGRGLDVQKATILTAEGETISALYEQVTADGMSRLVLNQSLPPQRVTLNLDYEAAFGDSLNGLYKVTVGENSYAFSQLESIAARKVFPAFDEPAFKTPFEISVTTRREYSAFSNTMAVETRELRRGMKRIRYARTAPLPTYLIAFAVGPLDVVEWRPVPPSPYRDDELPLRGITVQGQGERIGFALQNTAPILLALEDYFGTAYPYDKLDIVAVPDFRAGAMENAGLITYREPIILMDDPPAVDTVRRYAITHTHELAHQWFGNLVTMPWWDDIWLNEAFASWIQARIAHDWDPQYRFDRETQVRAIHAMREDSLISARQVREPVDSTADIKNAFDAITYAKGAGVLQMLEKYLGETTFRTGLREHMQRYAFATATVYDLMDSLQRVAGEQFRIESIFESFLFQPGVPYLTIEKQCSKKAGAGGFERVLISQQRFLPVGSGGDPDQVWTIPICFVYGWSDESADSPTTSCILLSDKTQSFPIEGNRSCPDWLMPNADGAGYFRWRMERQEIESLLEVFPTSLNDGERLSFVDSLMAGASNGSFTVTTLLNILPMIGADPDWRIVAEPLTFYKRLFDEVIDPDLRTAARDYASDIYLPRLAEATRGAAQSAEASALRNRLVRFLAIDLGVPDLRAKLVALAHRYLGYQISEGADMAALDPDLLRPALIAAVQDSDQGFVAFLIDRFHTSLDARFRQDVITALAFVINPADQALVRTFALGPDVRLNEMVTWLAWLLNPDARDDNWPWVQGNLDEILAIGGERVGRDAPYTFGRWLCSEDDASELAALFNDRLDGYPGSARNLARGLERIDLCTGFRARHAADANKFFAGADGEDKLAAHQ